MSRTELPEMSWDRGARLAAWGACALGAVVLCVLRLANALSAADLTALLVAGYVFCRAADHVIVQVVAWQKQGTGAGG
jgi:hypothetical protein